jgi:periplasmic protein TonB
MSHHYTDNLTLPWSNVAQESKRFRLILILSFVFVLPIAFIIPGVKLVEKERSQLEALPPQLAKVIIEKKKQVEKPKQEKPKEEKKEPEKKPEEKPPEPKKKEKPKPKPKKSPPEQTVKQAQKVAKSSGLLALQDDLADMRSSLDTSALTSTPTGSMVASTIAAKTSAIDSGSVRTGSGGVNTREMAVPAETVVLAERTETILEENEAEKLTAQAKKRSKGKMRSSGNIRRVFDQNKSSLFTLYNRELRKNPSLQGKVVLSLTIEPDGTVSSCEIVSSDLDSPKLERKIVSRVRLFNFGAMPVEVKVVTYPIDFFQS